MALIKCADCGKEISDKAKACIHCGCPVDVSAQKAVDSQKTAADHNSNGSRGLSVPFHAVLQNTESGRSMQKVFVKELSRNVEFAINNNTKVGESIRVNLRENNAFSHIIFTAVSVTGATPAAAETNSQTNDAVNDLIKQIFGSVNQNAPAAPAQRTIPDLDRKVRELKRRVYIKPVIRLVFNLYFICSFLGMFLMMYLYPDGGAPELLMNVIGIGFSVGFIPVFCFNFLPYVLAQYPDPGFFMIRKIMKNLEKRNLLEQAVTEIEICEPVPFGDKMCLSDHFLYHKNKNGAIIPCDELLWVYGSFSNRRGYGYLMLGTEKWGMRCFSRIRGRKRFEQAAPVAIQALRRRNPAILVGENRENRKKYFKELKK